MRIAVFITLLALVAPPAYAAVTLHVTSGSTQADVTLADTYIAVQSPKVRTIYDFSARRRIEIDLAARTYVDFSLFDMLGFRVMEMENRKVLNGALASVKLDAALGRTVDIENELAVAKDKASVIDEKTDGDMLRFSSGGMELASWSKSGAKVDAADAARFAQFVRYTQGGHPQLLEKLAKSGMIPDRLTLTMRSAGGVRTLNLAMAAVQPAQPPAHDVKGYAPRASGQGLDALLDRVAAMSPQQLDALRAAHPCDNSVDFSDANVMDTMLGRIECTLATGKPMAQPAAAQMQAVRDSPSLTLMFASINPAKPEQYADAVKTLVELRKLAPRKAHVLKLFEANHRLRLRQYKESQQLFEEVLEADPVLGGAYKDLGDLLLMQYDSPRAWRSWDTGRRVSPGLPNFQPVNQFESGMTTQHPEYF
jgi:tetratricopeptide (TPR) repeat protein